MNDIEVHCTKYRIKITRLGEVLYWSNGGLMELYWQADLFVDPMKAEHIAGHIGRQNPDWMVEVIVSYHVN